MASRHSPGPSMSSVKRSLARSPSLALRCLAAVAHPLETCRLSLAAHMQSFEQCFRRDGAMLASEADWRLYAEFQCRVGDFGCTNCRSVVIVVFLPDVKVKVGVEEGRIEVARRVTRPQSSVIFLSYRPLTVGVLARVKRNQTNILHVPRWGAVKISGMF